MELVPVPGPVVEAVEVAKELGRKLKPVFVFGRLPAGHCKPGSHEIVCSSTGGVKKRGAPIQMELPYRGPETRVACTTCRSAAALLRRAGVPVAVRGKKFLFSKKKLLFG